ncbi:MAG: hypothetical protein V1663_04625 [archaeon]
MAKIHLPINISFLFIFLGVLLLAVIEGKNITSSLLGESVYLGGGEVQQIAFIILTLFILINTTLNPDKMYLVAYSSMTLGLIVVLGALYNRFNNLGNELGLFQIVIGFVLILGGFFLFKGTRLNKSDKEMANYEWNKYKRVK